MRYLLPLFLLPALLGCQGQPQSDNNTVSKNVVKDTFPTKPLAIGTDKDDDFGPYDVRLSITEIKTGNNFKSYKALSTFNGHVAGFELYFSTVPATEGKEVQQLLIKSIGMPSDSFLAALSKIYKLPSQACSFKNAVPVNFIDMNDFAKAQFGKQPAGSASQTRELKLFFESADAKQYAELYLNLNERGHWIELQEKDKEYRKPIIGFLSKGK